MDRIENGMYTIKGSSNRDLQKLFRCIALYKRKIFKAYFNTFTLSKCNEIHICYSDIQKHVSYKNDINSTNILCTGLHKSFPIHYCLRGEFFQSVF